MSGTKRFHLGDILTVATGIFCTPNGMGAVYEVCNWMTGDDLMTHQLPRASEECAPEIYRQHPDLADVVIPQFSGKEAGMAMLAGLTARYGEYRDLTPMDPDDHTRIDPIAELKMRRPDMPIVEVEL